MHRILHYVVMANRLRVPVPVEKLVQKVAVNWNKPVDEPPPLVEVKKEVAQIPIVPITSLPPRQS